MFLLLVLQSFSDVRVLSGVSPDRLFSGSESRRWYWEEGNAVAGTQSL